MALFLLFLFGLIAVSNAALVTKFEEIISAPKCMCTGEGPFEEYNDYMAMNCGTDGKLYKDPCEFANARAKDPKLGLRPCKKVPLPTDEELFGNPQKYDSIKWLRSVHYFCMTDGKTYNGTMNSALRWLHADPTRGNRCHKPCPCQDGCPNKGPFDENQPMSPSKSMFWYIHQVYI